MRAPSAGVPLPPGSPVPSGRTLISQAAISAGLSGFPRFGACPRAALALNAIAKTTTHARMSGIHMLHLPRPFDRPTRNRVVVLAWKCGDGRYTLGLSSDGYELGSGRL